MTKSRGIRARRGLAAQWLPEQLATRPTTDDCWMDWPFGCDGGGRPMIKNERVARLVLTMTAGPAEGRWALHSCDNPPCWNPAHLRWGTHADNMRDASERGRLSQRPTPFGEGHPQARLTESQVKEILARLAEGETCSALGREYGVSHSAVNSIKFGKTWRHLTQGVSTRG